MKKLLTFALCAVLVLSCAGALYGCKPSKTTTASDEQIIARLESVILNFTPKKAIEQYGGLRIISTINTQTQDMRFVEDGDSLYSVNTAKDENNNIGVEYYKENFLLEENNGTYPANTYTNFALMPDSEYNTKTVVLTKGTSGNTLIYTLETLDVLLTLKYEFNANDSVAKMNFSIYNDEESTVFNEFIYEKQSFEIPAAVKAVDLNTNALKLEKLSSDVEYAYANEAPKRLGGIEIKHVNIKLDDTVEESTFAIDDKAIMFESSGTQQYVSGNDVFIADSTSVTYSLEPYAYAEKKLGLLQSEFMMFVNAVLSDSNAVLTVESDGAMTVQVGTGESAKYVKLNKDLSVTEIVLVSSKYKKAKTTVRTNVKVAAPEKIAAYQKTEQEKTRGEAYKMFQNITMSRIVSEKGLLFSANNGLVIKMNFGTNYEEGIEVSDGINSSCFYKGDIYPLKLDGTAVDYRYADNFYKSVFMKYTEAFDAEQITITEDAATKNKMVTFSTDGNKIAEFVFLPNGLLSSYSEQMSSEALSATVTYGAQEVSIPDFVKNYIE